MIPKNHVLPDNYTIVPAVALKTTSIAVPQLIGEYIVFEEEQLANAKLQEKEWLKHTSHLLNCSDTKTRHTIAWSA